MKTKNLFSILTLAAMMLTMSGFAQLITGSKHDMSAAGWNTAATNKLCGVCHTPHNSVMSVAPLWSHATSVATYSIYASTGTNASLTYQATGTQPDGTSKACLACHDGTVALDNFIPAHAPSATTMTGSALVGIDLSNDHPISFTYNATLVTNDGELQPTTAAFLTGTIATHALDANGKMQCASCHDVHKTTFTKFLNQTNTNSELCFKCHIK